MIVTEERTTEALMTMEESDKVLAALMKACGVMRTKPEPVLKMVVNSEGFVYFDVGISDNHGHMIWSRQ